MTSDTTWTWKRQVIFHRMQHRKHPLTVCFARSGHTLPINLQERVERDRHTVQRVAYPWRPHSALIALNFGGENRSRCDEHGSSPQPGRSGAHVLSMWGITRKWGLVITWRHSKQFNLFKNVRYIQYQVTEEASLFYHPLQAASRATDVLKLVEDVSRRNENGLG